MPCPCVSLCTCLLYYFQGSSADLSVSSVGPAQVMGAVAMQRSTPQLPDGLPGWLAALLQSCFAYEPSARPSAQQLVDTLKVGSAGVQLM
jgi:hypothetical protein